MLAFVLTLALFAAWSLIGVAVLAVVRADLTSLRVSLSAPAIGTAVYVLVLFVFSSAGVPLTRCAIPIGVSLLLGAAAAVALTRPSLPSTLLPIVAVSVAGLVLVGRPMFEFGFDWLANANGDMAFYVLAATQLVHHGLQSPVDVAALAANRDFATSAQTLHLAGLRPGAQIGLAGVSVVTGRPPVSLYMPMLLALNMCCVCAAGSLAMQASRRWWAAVVAAAVLAVSPMMAYGILQQLMPQVWGLALAVALVSWLMRADLHQNPGARLPDLVVLSLLTAALFVVYVELGASLSLSYALFFVLLLVQRRISVSAVARLWLPPIAVTAIVVNTFLSRELGYLHRATQFGVSTINTNLPLFGYAMVPTALPGAEGLQRIFAAPSARPMQALIVVSALVFLAVVVASFLTLRTRAAAVVVLVGDLLLGILLARNSNDFALLKLYMYVQPFLAAAVGFWLAEARSRILAGGAALVLAAVFALQIPTLNAYVNGSRNPIDLRNASDQDLLPRFRTVLRTASAPIVSVTDNFALAPLEGASAGDRPIYFISRNVFNLPWQERRFVVSTQPLVRTIFQENTEASRLLSRESCTLVLPTGSGFALNRRALPEGGSDLAVLPCAKARNLLAFIVSSRGQPSTVPLDRRAVSFWQLEQDPSFPGQTFSGFGRYALFEILGATPTIRIALTFSTSSTHTTNGSYLLPPAAVVGADRRALPVTGSGSARVFSAPLQPRLINGRPYVALDMGRNGQFPIVTRPGLTGLWGTSIPLDPRSLTSYVRDVSLISEPAYDNLRAPRAIRNLPQDLANPDLEYSGIYEDGWLGKDAYAVLASGRQAELVIRADVLAHENRQELRVLVNGRLLTTRNVEPGPLELRLPLSASRARRKVELRWAEAAPLSAADPRPAAAHLTFLGIAARTAG